MKDDIPIGQPTNPGANAEVLWINTEDGTFKDFAGFVGDVLFDEDVTLVVQTWADGGTPRVMNGGGAGEVIAADTPTQVRVGFLGANTLIKLVVGSAAPTVWHANGRATKGDLGFGGTGVASYGLPLVPTGADGAPGADGADGAPGADGADGAPGADGSPAWVGVTWERKTTAGALSATKYLSILGGADGTVFTLPNGTYNGQPRLLSTLADGATGIYHVHPTGTNIQDPNQSSVNSIDLDAAASAAVMLHWDEVGYWVVGLMVGATISWGS